MAKKKYRGAELPKGLTENAITSMIGKIKKLTALSEVGFLCHVYEDVTRYDESGMHPFLLNLNISISGSGFCTGQMPAWLEELTEDVEPDGYTTVSGNFFRLYNARRIAFLTDILRVCFKH